MSLARQSEKLQADRLQLLIADLVKDEENKYCADCDAKGPRWASWNLGVFLCIRCAGIHRGLGVHISKVKSLNLDAWETQQIAMLRSVGNRRARQLYEANLPDFFRRPQTDPALEQFIRAKYEQKKYVTSDFVSPKPDMESIKKDLLRLEQQSKRKSISTRLINLPLQNSYSSKTQGRTLKSIARNSDANTEGGTANISGISPPMTIKNNDSESFAADSPTKHQDIPLQSNSMAKSDSGSFSADLLEINFGETLQASSEARATDRTGEKTIDGGDQRTTKESILALYALSKSSALPTSSGQNGTTSVVSGNCSSNHLPNEVPRMYQPPAPSNAFNWNSIHVTLSSDLFDLDTLHSGQRKHGSKPAPQRVDLPAMIGITANTPGASANTLGSTFSLQQQWVSTQPAAASSAFALSSSAQQSYLTQVQNKLASMQLHGRAVE